MKTWKGGDSVDLEYYRNFLTVVDAGNMTAAAESLHITQPTLSKQLRILEDWYGAKLLVTDRGRRTMYLTDAGKVLYRRARHLCAIEDLTREEVMESLQAVRGTLRLSISHGRSSPLIQRVLVRFRRRYPEVRYEFHEGIITTLQEQILTGVTELGICGMELTEPERFEILYPQPERLLLFGRESCPRFPQSESIKVEELAGIPLALSGSCKAILEQEANELVRRFDIVSVSSTKATALAWALTGDVAALVPGIMDEPIWAGLRICRVQHDFPMGKSVVRAADRPLSTVARAFLRFYGKYLKEKPK